MKELPEVTVCVVDYGKFIELTRAFAGKCRKVYYHSPMDREFQDINDCAKGDGIDGVERLDSFLDPEILKEIDLFVFPDIGFDGTQRHLRELGKAVWGALGAGDLELYRTRFINFLKQSGLPLVPSEKVVGLVDLWEHLKTVEDKWIKVNRYRACLETYHHRDFDHSVRKLEEWAVRFGGLKDRIVFVVQDTIDCDVEIGYDGWTVDGRFPEQSFQGYELKNELYLGSLLAYDDLPEEVRQVNDALAPVLADFGSRSFLATEIRIKDKVPYFIDLTARMAGLTQDPLPELCTNLADVIWNGANGNLIWPEYEHNFVAVATLHCSDHVRNQWFTLRVPEKVRRWTKLYHYCEADGLYHFIPSVPLECDEAGVIIGAGNSIKEAIDHLNENFKELESEPLNAETLSFTDLLKQIRSAEDEGVEFTAQKIPAPESVLSD